MTDTLNKKFRQPFPVNEWKKTRICNVLILLARLKGVEPLAYGLEVRCSIQLSYRRARPFSITMLPEYCP